MADYYVYIIRSKSKNWHYVGFTKNVTSRIMEHNKGNVISTKSYRPFDLVFVQIVDSTIEARKLEKFLKIRFNKEAIINLL